MASSRGPGPAAAWHSLVDGVHDLIDAGLLPIAQLLARLPEAQILSWGRGCSVEEEDMMSGWGHGTEEEDVVLERIDGVGERMWCSDVVVALGKERDFGRRTWCRDGR